MSKAKATRAKKQAEQLDPIVADTKDDEIPQVKSKLIADEKNEEKQEEVVEKRVLRPKRSTSSLPKVQQAPAPKPPTGRKRKNSGEKIEKKEDEKQEDTTEDLKETSGRKGSKPKIPVLFEDSDDENQENEPEKKPAAKPRGRKPSATRMKKSTSASNMATNLSVSATATAIVNSGISNTSSMIEENKVAPKSIMKSKENKMEPEVEDAKKSKRGVRIQDELGPKSEIIGVKCDKHKYSASTSTPSGLRRKPLKLPQDVSMICKPETETNASS